MDEFTRFSRLVLMVQNAALNPDQWNSTVSAIVKEVGASEGILFSPFLPPSLGGFWASRSILPSHMEDYAAYYYDKDIWILAMQPEQMDKPGFVFRDEAVINPNTVKRSEFYNDFLRKLDIGRLLCGVVMPHSSSTIPGSLHLSAFKPMKKGAFSDGSQELLQRLMPHLQVAIKTHYILGSCNSQLNLSDAALNTLVTPLLIVNCESKILFANHSARRVFSDGDGITTEKNILKGLKTSESSAIKAFVASLFDKSENTLRRWVINIERPSGRRPYVCFGQSLPAGSAIGGTNGQQAAVLFLREPDARDALELEQMQQLYGLTPAESLLAASLVNGLTVEQAANAKGISYETARTQLKNLFRKTGCLRQTELVKILTAGTRI